jgi:ubiquinone biosynthesis protein
MPVPSRSSRWRIAVRSLQVVRAGLAAAGTFLATWRRRRRGPDAALGALGVALVRFTTRLGATFIKVGQIASTRADLLPGPLVHELATLRDRVPPFPFADVRRTIEADLGRPLEALFDRFETAPVAAASVAQVHRAVWRATGETVAVKVRRPDVLEAVRLDRAILVFVGRWLERLVPSVRLTSLADALGHFCDAVEEQIHLRNEAAHNARFAANFAGDREILVPRLYPDACSDAVLTMEFVDGVSEDGLEQAGLDVRRIVEAGMRCVCRMVFSHGFVHADLHPGNLRFLPPARVVLLDLGLVGRLTDEDRIGFALLIHALVTGDGPTVARLFHDNAPFRATPDYAAYERDVVAFIDDVRHVGLDRLQVTAEIGRMFDILRRHRIQARSHLTMVNLAMMTAEGLGKRLAPDLSLTDAALPYVAEALRAAGAETASALPR